MIPLMPLVVVAQLQVASSAMSLSVDDVMTRAAQVSDEADATQASVFRAVAEKRRALSEWLPQVNGIASYDRTLATIYDDEQLEGTPFGQRNAYSLSLSVVENLFAGFATRSRQKAALANMTSAEIGVAQAKAQAVYDCVQAYYDALLATELELIASATYAQADAIFASLEASYKEGNSSEFDFLRAKVARDTQQPAVVRARVDRSVTVLRLKQLLNIPDEQEVTLTSALEATPREEVTPDPTTRAPVRQAAALVDAQIATLARVESQHYPRLDANFQYARLAFPSGLPAFDDFSTNWTVGLALSVNIFSGLRITGDVEYAKADIYEARARLRQVQERSRLDTFDAVQQLEAARATLDAASGTIHQAQRTHDIATMRFHQGISTQLELNDARLQLQTAKTNYAQAARDVQVASTRVALLPLLPIMTQSQSTPGRMSTLGSGLTAQQLGASQSLGSTGAPSITANAGTSLSSPSSAQGTR